VEQLVEGSSLDLSRLLEQRDLFGLFGLDPPVQAPADPTGAALEARVAGLLARQGYQVERAGGRGGGGVDLIAEKRDAVGTRVRLWVQCKATSEPAGVDVVRSLNGALPPGDRGVTGVVVCPAGFTAEARSFAAARRIELWDANRLEQLERGGDKRTVSGIHDDQDGEFPGREPGTASTSWSHGNRPWLRRLWPLSRSAARLCRTCRLIRRARLT